MQVDTALKQHNDRAKRIARRGLAGTLSVEYETEHDVINAWLYEWERQRGKEEVRA